MGREEEEIIEGKAEEEGRAQDRKGRGGRST
jgi:hypothetical protein